MDAILGFVANPTVRDIGFGVLVTLGILMIMTGRLVPRSTHESELATANKRGDEWKETALAGRKVIEVQAEQISKFADAAKTPAEFFGTVMRTGGGFRESASEGPSHN